MNVMSTIKGVLPLATLLLAIAYPAQAANTYEWSGKIDSVSLKKGTLIVRDRGLILSTNYKVYDRHNKPVSAFNLRNGKRVKVLVDTKTNKVIRVDILE